MFTDGNETIVINFGTRRSNTNAHLIDEVGNGRSRICFLILRCAADINFAIRFAVERAVWPNIYTINRVTNALVHPNINHTTCFISRNGIVCDNHSVVGTNRCRIRKRRHIDNTVVIKRGVIFGDNGIPLNIFSI